MTRVSAHNSNKQPNVTEINIFKDYCNDLLSVVAILKRKQQTFQVIPVSLTLSV